MAPNRDEEWKEETATAVSTLATTVASAAAVGQLEVVRESYATTGLVINLYSTTLDTVTSQAVQELEARTAALQKAITKNVPAKTHTQKCLEEYKRNKKKATTPGDRAHYLVLYLICLTQGYNINFPINLGP